jgi:ABC-type transport system involved in Fe-S cluster assembly fused permease/ATPase subunit
VIFSTALSTAMVLCSHGIMNGQMTVGDLVKLFHKRRNYHKALYIVLTDG